MNEKKKKSANYALEMLVNKAGEPNGENTWAMDVWGQIKDGFISPVEALDFAREQKIRGTIRVVRIASDLFGGGVVVQEPVYSLKKITLEDKPKAKVGRKPRKVKVDVPKQEDPPIPVDESEMEPPLTEEEDLPPVPDPIALG